MKKLALALLFLAAGFATSAQSRSYEDLDQNFGGESEVISFGLSGPVCRLAVSMIGIDDEYVAEALKGVKHVRVMVIPMEHFEQRGLSVRGFKSRLVKDNFELMADIREPGSYVTVYHRAEKKTDRYFVLVQEDGEVVAIEMKGYIDPAIFQDSFTQSSL